jgi:glycosyltransferase involved in cell wall biosynthesis
MTNISPDAPLAADRPTDPLFSVVVPVYNEEACVSEMVSRLKSVFAGANKRWELLFIDDGSRDQTLMRLRELAAHDERVQYVSFSRNFGHQVALTAGIDNAFGDAVITLDGDLQHPPELIPTLIERWMQGYDVVYTVRISNRGHPVKEFVSKLYYWMLRKLTGVDVASGGADFRLVDRKVADALRACGERNVFVRGLVPWLGFRRFAVPYDAAERFGGETKYVTRRMLRFALDGVLAFSIIPLRLIAWLGALTVSLGVFYGVYTLCVRLFTDQTASGWTSLMVVILVFSGTQLLSLGILSEYVGRIYEEVKQRPRYVIGATSSRIRQQHGRTPSWEQR